MHYRYQLEGGAFPDPASRFQPTGPHAASQIIDPHTFAWSDHDWRGVEPHARVIYEMHVGTFTAQGRACRPFGSRLRRFDQRIFDAEAPFAPRGCIAQAWSVAEALRCWSKTEPANTAGA